MKVHYFQRYSEKENVATSNTMLLLSRLYHYSTDKFYKLLKINVFNNEFDPELSFNIQEKTRKSVPDATIIQDSFKIVVETKLYDWFHTDQLIHHLDAFGDENYKVLITLASERMNDKTKKEFDDFLVNYNKEHSNTSYVVHINTTFEELVKNIQDILDEVQDFEMLEIVDDFFDYCCSDNLIRKDKIENYMKMQLSGSTMKLNIEKSLYYDKEKMKFNDYGYLGLYTDKSVRAIGKIIARIIAWDENGEIKFQEEKGEITQERKDMIIKAIEDAPSINQNLRGEPHRYFFVDKFYETDFKKVSKGAPFGPKKFDLKGILEVDELPTTQEIAELLKEKSWT